MTVPVNVDNFVRAETARMFGNFVKMPGETTKWRHVLAPAKPGDLGAVVQTNRDEDRT